MSASSYELAVAPVGLSDMVRAFFSSARRLRATANAAHAARIRGVVSTYSDRAADDAQLGRLDVAALRASSFARRG